MGFLGRKGEMNLGERETWNKLNIQNGTEVKAIGQSID